MNSFKKKLLKVELYEIKSEDMLARLDSLEWHPNWYKRIPVVTLDNEQIEIYHMPLDKNHTLIQEWYLDKMVETVDNKYLYFNWTR